MDRFMEQIVVKKNRFLNELMYVMSFVLMVITGLLGMMSISLILYSFSIQSFNGKGQPFHNHIKLHRRLFVLLLGIWDVDKPDPCFAVLEAGEQSIDHVVADVRPCGIGYMGRDS